MGKSAARNKLVALTTAAVLLLAVTACSGEQPAAEPPVDPNPVEEGVQEPVQPAEPNPEEGEKQEPVKPGDPEEGQSTETKQGTGTYVGQIDNHSVEIETEDGPTAFRLGDHMNEAIAGLQGNEEVAFEYFEEPVEGDEGLKQFILTKITVRQSGSGQGADTSQLPATKEVELELEGMKETKTAKLASGNGYSLYIFDIFSFDAKTGKLTMNVDPDYYVEITKLPSDYNGDMLKQEAEKELAEVGKVLEAKENERNQALKNAPVYMIARGEQLTREYIVAEIDGQGFIFRVNIPHREPTEGFVPHAFASLATIVNQ